MGAVSQLLLGARMTAGAGMAAEEALGSCWSEKSSVLMQVTG